jgi:hypothetical protein
MPFTPYHLGPALAIGLPLQKYLHAPTFIVANIILDIEPFLVLEFNLNYPLHGYFHTLLSALAIGLLLGYIMFKLEKSMQPFYRKMKLETNNSLKLKSFLFAGVLGTMLHVLFDAFLYIDIKPFFPSPLNPLLLFFSSTQVYLICVILGIFGLSYYLLLLAYSNRKQRQKT